MGDDNEIKHCCAENWYDDAVVKYSRINSEQMSWVLEEEWDASGLDVEEGHAEERGQAISFHILLISYCPFCGENLTAIRPNEWTRPA